MFRNSCREQELLWDQNSPFSSRHRYLKSLSWKNTRNINPELSWPAAVPAGEFQHRNIWCFILSAALSSSQKLLGGSGVFKKKAQNAPSNGKSPQSKAGEEGEFLPALPREEEQKADRWGCQSSQSGLYLVIRFLHLSGAAPAVP